MTFSLAVLQIGTVGKLVYVGDALVLSNYTATDGILYVIDNVLGSKNPNTMLSTDVSINETAVLGATKLSDADVFSPAKVLPQCNLLCSSCILAVVDSERDFLC